MSKSVLIVDDSFAVRSLIKKVMITAGFDKIEEASTGESAIDMALKSNPDVITLDNLLPDMLGTDVLKVIMESDVKSNVVVVSAVDKKSVIKEEIELGAVEYIVKPFNENELVDLVNKL